MYRLLALLLSILACHSAIGQTQGRVLARPDHKVQPDTPAVIDLTIVDAVAIPDGFGSLELYLLPESLPTQDLGSALAPAQVLRRRLAAADQTYVRVGVRPATGTASASVSRGPLYGPYLGSGVLIGGRLEDGRLRGRLAVVNGYGGQSLVDVAVDAHLVTSAEGQALPADGGDPWQGFLRVRAALLAGDESGFRAALVPDLAQEMPTGDAFQSALAGLREKFPMDLPLERGWLTSVDARLVLLDRPEAEPVRVLIDMARVEGDWKLQDISSRPPGTAVEPEEVHAFASGPSVDDSPLRPGVAISTGMSLRGHSLQPRHAIALADPSRAANHWILLTEAPLAADRLALLFSGGSMAPLFPNGQIEAIVVITETVATAGGSKVTHVDRSGVLRQAHGSETVFDLASLGTSGIAQIDGVIYGHFQADAHQLLFAAPVLSANASR